MFEVGSLPVSVCFACKVPIHVHLLWFVYPTLGLIHLSSLPLLCCTWPSLAHVRRVCPPPPVSPAAYGLCVLDLPLIEALMFCSLSGSLNSSCFPDRNPKPAPHHLHHVSHLSEHLSKAIRALEDPLSLSKTHTHTHADTQTPTHTVVDLLWPE